MSAKQSEPTSDAPHPTEAQPPEQALSGALDTLDWEQMLAGRSDWTRQPGSTAVLCPKDQPLSLTCVSNPRRLPERSRLTFRGALRVCCDCTLMAACFPSAHPTKSKLLAFTVTLDDGAMVNAALQRARKSSRRKRREAPLSDAINKRSPAPARVTLAVQKLDTEPVSGPYAVVDPLLLPAAARRLFYRATRNIDVTVTIDLPEAQLPHPKLLARSKADRQHRRCTWDEHRDRYALPAEARVSIRLDGGGALAKIVGETPRSQHRTAG